MSKIKLTQKLTNEKTQHQYSTKATLRQPFHQIVEYEAQKNHLFKVSYFKKCLVH